MSEKYLTHYQVLGVPLTASERDIKIAYRKAARITHPDHGGDPAVFRKVTEAYEVLIDPAKKLKYDKSYNTPAGSYGAARSSSAGSTSSFTTRRTRETRNVAGEPAVYVPAFNEQRPGETPLLPRTVAAQPVHGAPRKRGVFGASSRLAREARTAQLIMQQVLPAIPAARLINGLSAPNGSGYLDHVLVSGYRIGIVGSMLVPDGAFRWDGSTLIHGNKVVTPPQLIPATRALSDLFPECNVTAWVCVHSSTGNLFEPVIDYARGCEPDGSNVVNVANAARFAREVKHFLASGPAPNVVDLHVLGRLLGGMY
ncbi:J domain-containing protein [Arthrobacter alpinus]|uniref:J domain-containing protein n=1 Tax=Arthrobacter alpinus TaxID=656366 RepID=UPI0016458796|nr:J domain-containing protein [Arthrobacter alpinus]